MLDARWLWAKNSRHRFWKHISTSRYSPFCIDLFAKIALVCFLYRVMKSVGEVEWSKVRVSVSGAEYWYHVGVMWYRYHGRIFVVIESVRNSIPVFRSTLISNQGSFKNEVLQRPRNSTTHKAQTGHRTVHEWFELMASFGKRPKHILALFEANVLHQSPSIMFRSFIAVPKVFKEKHLLQMCDMRSAIPEVFPCSWLSQNLQESHIATASGIMLLGMSSMMARHCRCIGDV